MEAIDYRNRPSAADNPVGSSVGDYDHPTGADWQQAEPWTDQTWQGYDDADDAIRFRGINSPQQQAELHAEPDPVQGSQGWSPDLDQQLRWERAIDGSPPR